MIEGEGKFFELIRVTDGDRSAWLDVRRKGVGGSDVAAIMGLSKYRSPYEVWAEKSGLMEQDDISNKPQVMWGNILEPVVGEHYASEHPKRKVRRVNAVLRSLSRPWAQASLDYEVRDEERGWGVLEIKTAGLRVADDWDDGVPVYYQTQVMHYLSVTGREFADVAVLIGGNDYREFRIERDRDDIRAVEKAVDDFWRVNIEGGKEPDATGIGGEPRAILMNHKDHADDFTGASDMPVQIADFILATEEKKRAEDEYRRASDAVKLLIGNHKGFECDGGRVTWIRSTSKRFDSKQFKADNPEIYDEYMKPQVRDGGLRWSPRKGK